MRRLFIAVPAIVLTMTMVALAQKQPDATPKKPADDKAADKAAQKTAMDPNAIAAAISLSSKALDEMLVKSLLNSPDVQLAEARLKEAEAALRQARMLVAQKTIEAQQNLDARQHDVARAEAMLRRAKTLHDSGQMSATEFSAIEAELAKQKAAIAQIESQVNMLTGKLPAALDASVATPMLFRRFQGNLELSGGPVTVIGSGLGGGGEPTAKRLPQEQMAGRLRKLLSMPFKVPDPAGGVPVPDLIAMIRDTTGAPILTKGLNNEVARIDFKGELTLAAYFQMLCDSVPNVSIYVRDYGLLITTDAPPEDALPFMDFWRAIEKSGK
jgi:hypothetical protein